MIVRGLRCGSKVFGGFMVRGLGCGIKSFEGLLLGELWVWGVECRVSDFLRCRVMEEFCKSTARMNPRRHDHLGQVSREIQGCRFS